MDYYRRRSCKICGKADFVKFLDFGRMPLAGGFITKAMVGKEPLFPLAVYYCKNCTLVQLRDVVSPKIIFEGGVYLSSTTRTLSQHFKEYAKEMKHRFLRANQAFAVEIGSNDGVLLKHIKSNSIKVLGVEPGINAAKIARGIGINTLCDFFSRGVAEQILRAHGRADAIFANNVFAHIDDLHGIVEGIKTLLKPKGVFVFEVHHVASLIFKMQYDQIYHEHLYYYSLHALDSLLAMHDLEIFEVKKIPIHGGSVRVYARARTNKEKGAASLKKILAEEHRMGITTVRLYRAYGKKVKKHTLMLAKFIKSLKKGGATIVGYGAPGKAVVLINACKIGPSVMSYIADASPLKQGLYTPGLHIPIVKPSRFRKDKPDYAVIFAWNFAEEILKKERDYIKDGGKFIIPVPKIKVITS